jgi:chromosome segregation protein
MANAPSDQLGSIDLLLARTLVVRDRSAARRILPLMPMDARAVTLKGEVFYPGGHVVVTSAVDAGDPEDPVRKCERDLATAEANMRRAEGDAVRLRHELETARLNRDQAFSRLDAARSSVRGMELGRQQAALREQAAVSQHGFLSGQLAKLDDEQQRMNSARASLGGRDEELEAERVRLQAEVSAGSLSMEAEAGAMVVAQADARLQVARTASTDAVGRAAEVDGRLANLAGELEVRRKRLSTNREQQEVSRRELAEAEGGMRRVEEALAGVEGQTRAGEQALAAAEAERANLEAREAKARADLQAAERRHSQAQIELARRQQELTGLQQRIEDDFGLVAFEFDDGVTGQGTLPLNGLVEHLPVIDELPPDIENQVGRLRLQIRRMGAVNIEAKREYEEVRQRAEFLTSQLDDSRRAEGQIREVIAELDHLMEREFRKTFEAVASAFRQSFTQLFGGGSARLVLTDDQDLTNTGIDIEARLPGRREHGLAMLSGGERSLTACALIFSLLKVSPTPFCVLDEVDAMLDEANVGRFCDMLRELSLGTQFIVITHNRQTIQSAEVVYGVSMAADSASRVISLKLDEAERLAAQRT